MVGWRCEGGSPFGVHRLPFCGELCETTRKENAFLKCEDDSRNALSNFARPAPPNGERREVNGERRTANAPSKAWLRPEDP